MKSPHAGAPISGDVSRHYVETYCYAFAGANFLEDEQQQLYWRTDIVQMTRHYMLEAARSGIRLSPRRAGFRVGSCRVSGWWDCSGDESSHEGAEQGLAAPACVMHELEEAEVERQLVLRDPTVWSQPGS